MNTLVGENTYTLPKIQVSEIVKAAGITAMMIPVVIVGFILAFCVAFTAGVLYIQWSPIDRISCPAGMELHDGGACKAIYYGNSVLETTNSGNGITFNPQREN